jgi:integrase/recombinase XerC
MPDSVRCRYPVHSGTEHRVMTQPTATDRAITSALRRMPEWLAEDAKAWLYALQSEDKSPLTTLGYVTALLRFSGSLPAEVASVQEITHRHVQTFLASLRKGTNSTAVTRYISLGVFFRWAVSDGIVTVNPMDRVDRPASRRPATPIPELDDIRRMLATCNGGRRDFVSLRDTAIICLFADCGMRRAEIGSLRLTDVDLDNREIRVVGKGRKPRTNIISQHTRKALNDYLRARSRHWHAASPMLWLGAQQGPPITSNTIWQIITRRAKQAGVRVHPHSFRHYVADALLQDGREGDVMRTMGWSDRRMLDRYGAAGADRRALDAQRSAALGDRL